MRLSLPGKLSAILCVGSKMRRASLTSSVRFAAGALAVVGLSTASSVAQADIPPGLQASMDCVVEGKAVVCHVTTKPTPQSHITYSRADLVQSPAFLKTLVGSVDYSSGRDRHPRLNL